MELVKSGLRSSSSELSDFRESRDVIAFSPPYHQFQRVQWSRSASSVLSLHLLVGAGFQVAQPVSIKRTGSPTYDTVHVEQDHVCVVFASIHTGGDA